MNIEEELKDLMKDGYRLLHENAGTGIAYYSLEGIVLSYNQVAAKNMNGEPEDFVGKSIFDLFPKESADFYFARINKAVISTQPMVYEDLVQLPTEDKWFISTFTKIENSQQKVLGVQIISQDITKIKTFEIQLKNAKEKAEDSESKFRKSIEYSPIPTVIAKNNGALIILNKQFVKTYGYTLEEMPSMKNGLN